MRRLLLLLLALFAVEAEVKISFRGDNLICKGPEACESRYRPEHIECTKRETDWMCRASSMEPGFRLGVGHMNLYNAHTLEYRFLVDEGYAGGVGRYVAIVPVILSVVISVILAAVMTRRVVPPP